MERVKRILSAVIVISFFLNIVVSDLALGQSLSPQTGADNLSTPKMMDDIVGVRAQDANNITAWTRGCLEVMRSLGFEVKRDNLIMMEKNPEYSEIFNPPNGQFLIHESEPLVDGRLAVKVRVWEVSGTNEFSRGTRTYYALFPKELPRDREIPPVKTYTESAYKGLVTKGYLVLAEEATRRSASGSRASLNPQQIAATEKLNALPVLGKEETVKAYYDQAIKERYAAERIKRDLGAELAQLLSILKNVRPNDELSELILNPELFNVKQRQLDLLRAASEFAVQFLPVREGIDNRTRLSEVKQVFVRHPVISKLLIKYFETRFDPRRDINERSEAAKKIRIEEIQPRLKELGNFDEIVLRFTLNMFHETVKTDYYVDERVELFFRIDHARAFSTRDDKGALGHEVPHKLIWVHVPYGAFGVHSRYSDRARGGLRSIRADREHLLTEVLSEARDLSSKQKKKHISISEGGSKGAFFYEEGLNPVAAAVAYIYAFVKCMKEEEDDERIQAAYGAEFLDPLELGPDEGTAYLSTLASVLAWMEGLSSWRTIMSGRLEAIGGVPHMSNDLLEPPEEGNRVTSQGAMVHLFELVRWLRDTGKIASKESEPLTISVTAGMSGDVASGIVERAINHYGENARILTIGGGRAIAFDPYGLDHSELMRLYKEEGSTQHFDRNKLNDGGFVVEAKKGSGEESYIILGPEALKYMNTRALDQEFIQQIGATTIGEGTSYKELAGLKEDEPLVVVLERDTEGNPVKVKAHSVYLKDVIHFLVRADILATGGGYRHSINDTNWQLFFDRDGKPTAAGIVHGANVFITEHASSAIEEKGVVIEPDFLANSVGVEISSRMEIDWNSIYDLEEKENTPEIFVEYFRQVLAKCLADARKKFWALRADAKDNPGVPVVEKLAPKIADEIINLATRRIMRSQLIAETKSGYPEGMLSYLRRYFPDISQWDKAYESTLDRAFANMSPLRIKEIAAITIAENAVLNLGLGAIPRIAEATGARQIDVIEEYLNVAMEMNIEDEIEKIFQNENKMSPRQQLAFFKEIREDATSKIREKLNKKIAAGSVKASGMTRDSASGIGFSEGQPVTSLELAIAEAEALAYDAGLNIPTRQGERYNLLMTKEFFINGAECEAQKNKYGSRFELDMVSGTSDEQLINNIIGKAAGKETRTIALVPDTISDDLLKSLARKEIRFIRTDVNTLRNAQTASPEERLSLQENTYMIMAHIRRIDSKITPESSTYQLLEYYIGVQFILPEGMTAEDYIKAVLDNDVVKLTKVSFRPIVPFNTNALKDRHDGIARVSISA